MGYQIWYGHQLSNMWVEVTVQAKSWQYVPTYLYPFWVETPRQVPDFNVAAVAMLDASKKNESKQTNLRDFISIAFDLWIGKKGVNLKMKIEMIPVIILITIN